MSEKEEVIWLTEPVPFELSEEELHLYGWLRENEAILTVRMTRKEFEERFVLMPHVQPSKPL